MSAGNAAKFAFLWTWTIERRVDLATQTTASNLAIQTILRDRPTFIMEYLRAQKDALNLFRARLNQWMQQNKSSVLSGDASTDDRLERIRDLLAQERKLTRERQELEQQVFVEGWRAQDDNDAFLAREMFHVGLENVEVEEDDEDDHHVQLSRLELPSNSRM